MRRTSTGGLTIALLAGAAIASCNLTLGLDPYFDGGDKAASASASSGQGGADGGTGGRASTGGAGGAGGKIGQPGKAVWAYALGSTGADTVNAIAVGPNGDIFLTGKIGAASTLGCPNLDVDAGGSTMGGYLIEVNESGKCQWGVLFGLGAEGTGLAIDSAGVIALTGTLNGVLTLLNLGGSVSGAGIFVARVQAGGNALWAHTFYPTGGEMIVPAGAAIVPVGAAMNAGTAYFSGYTNGPLNMDNAPGLAPFSGGMDGFVLSCTADGVCTQTVHLSGTGGTDQEVLGVAVTSDGSELSIAGVSSGDTGFNSKTALVSAPTVSGMSPNAVVGSFTGTSSIRSTIFGDMAMQSGHSVAYDSDGALFFAGTYDGTMALGTEVLTTTAGTAVFLARFEAGSATVAAAVGLIPSGTGMNAQGVSGLTTDAAGDVVMVGTLRGMATLGTLTLAKSVGQEDIYVAKLGPSLTPKWLSLFGTPGSESADAVAIAKDGGIIVAGHFTMDINFSMGNPLNSAGLTDIFLVKLQP